MNFSPPLKQKKPIFRNDLKSSTFFHPLHSARPNNVGDAISATDQVNFGHSVSKYVDMGRRVVILEDAYRQSEETQYSNHLE